VESIEVFKPTAGSAGNALGAGDVLAGLGDAWLALRGAAIAMITKGFSLAKDYSLIGAKIIRDHG
jgi:hypothetical protein